MSRRKNSNRASKRKKAKELQQRLKSTKPSPQLSPPTPQAHTVKVATKTWSLKKFGSLILTFFKWGIGAFTLAASVVGFICFIGEFYPFISISPKADTSTDNFQDTKFVISNDSLLPFYKVTFRVECWDGDLKPGENRFVYLGGELLPHDIIYPRSSIVKRCTIDDIPRQSITHAFSGYKPIERPYYQIWVTYDPCDMSYFRTECGYAFWAQKNASGIYVWNPVGRAIQYKADQVPNIQEDY